MGVLKTRSDSEDLLPVEDVKVEPGATVLSVVIVAVVVVVMMVAAVGWRNVWEFVFNI